MAGITQSEAIKRMLQEIETFPEYDVVEIYNDLFPRTPVKVAEVIGERDRLLKVIVDYVHRGLELDETIDLWNVVFPEEPTLYWDEEENQFGFNPLPEPLYDD